MYSEDYSIDLLFSGIFACGLCAVIIFAGSEVSNTIPWAISVLVILAILMLITLLIIGRQPNTTIKLTFKVNLSQSWYSIVSYINMQTI